MRQHPMKTLQHGATDFCMTLIVASFICAALFGVFTFF